MKLTIFGATGPVGVALIQEALSENHETTALVRTPAKISAYSDRLKLVVGDYFDADARAKALEGADAVLTTIGPPMKRAPNNGEYAKAMTELIGQMQKAEIQRIVAIGGAGLRLGDEELVFPRRIMRLMLRLFGGKGYWDKEREHNALFASRLAWTILRPPQIAPVSGEFVVSQDRPKAFKADPMQLAHHMMASLNDRESVHTAPFVATK
ncbi:MAG: NAD(P)-dependent oxidoreductase [Paracoccaceae bacterium]